MCSRSQKIAEIGCFSSWAEIEVVQKTGSPSMWNFVFSFSHYCKRFIYLHMQHSLNMAINTTEIYYRRIIPIETEHLEIKVCFLSCRISQLISSMVSFLLERNFPPSCHWAAPFPASAGATTRIFPWFWWCQWLWKGKPPIFGGYRVW